MPTYKYVRLVIFTIFVTLILFGGVVSCDTDHAPQSFDLPLTKSASPTTFSEVGEQIEFTFELKLSKLPDLVKEKTFNFTITDPLIRPITCPGYAAYPADSGIDKDYWEDLFSGDGSIRMGQTVVCTGLYTVTAADVERGEIINNASVKTDTKKVQTEGLCSYNNWEYTGSGSATSPKISYVSLLPEPEVPLLPDEIPVQVLDGTVPHCDPRTKAMNLRLDPAADAEQVNAQLASGEMVITIGGLPAICSVPQSNPSLVSCIADPAVVFPAQVVVTVNESIVNDFVYDGQGCVENKPAGGEDGESGVKCTYPPPGTPQPAGCVP